VVTVVVGRDRVSNEAGRTPTGAGRGVVVTDDGIGAVGRKNISADLCGSWGRWVLRPAVLGMCNHVSLCRTLLVLRAVALCFTKDPVIDLKRPVQEIRRSEKRCRVISRVSGWEYLLRCPESDLSDGLSLRADAPTGSLDAETIFFARRRRWEKVRTGS
jgi:hypothetical protein